MQQVCLKQPCQYNKKSQNNNQGKSLKNQLYKAIENIYS